MPRAVLSAVVARLSRSTDDESDGRLLRRFVQERDEAAFAELVRATGPMVLGVCRRVCRDEHLAEDAFQAAFLVLARRARDVRPTGSVRGWLHGVAVRTAREARSVSARRRTRELPVPTLPESSAFPAAAADSDALAALDEEIAALPDHLRAAVVLCELDGVSRKAAAEQLGVPAGTLSSRLAEARKRLATRLRWRGIALTAAGLTAAFDRLAAAAVPPELASRAAASWMDPASIPAPVASLVHGVTRIMFAQKLKAVPVALALSVVVVFAVGLLPAAEPPATRNPVVATFGSPVAIPQPAPKAADPMPLPKGPNRLLVWRKRSIVTLDPDGKNVQPVLTGQLPLHPMQCALSPDGKRVAVIVHPAEPLPFMIHVVGEDHKDGLPLGMTAFSFAWSPDGTAVAVTDFPGEPLVAVHSVVDVTTKERTALKLPDDHYVTDWSQDGKHLVTTRIWPHAGVFLMNRDGTERAALTAKRLPDGQFGVRGRLSPDGKRLLFTVVTPAEKARFGGAKTELAVLDLDGGKVTPVADTPLNGPVLSYCWSPNGSRIAYTWGLQVDLQPGDPVPEETEAHLVVCDPDGKNPRTVLSAKGRVVPLGGVDWR